MVANEGEVYWAFSSELVERMGFTMASVARGLYTQMKSAEGLVESVGVKITRSLASLKRRKGKSIKGRLTKASMMKIPYLVMEECTS